MRRSLVIVSTAFICFSWAPADNPTPAPPALQNPDQIVRPSETASPPSAARKIVKNIFSDQKAMRTSPFHTQPEDRKWWGTFGLGTAALIAGDRHISKYAPGKVTPILAYTLASVVSVSRFTARKHFASDILAGGAMGWFIGGYVFEHHLDPNIHKRYEQTVFNRLKPDVNPLLDVRTQHLWCLADLE
jgi:hypothetical protein